MWWSPNSERFQPPKEWKAIGTGIGTLMPTMPTWIPVCEIAGGVAVAGEDRGAVAVFVVVDQLDARREVRARTTTAPGRRSLPCRSHVGVTLSNRQPPRKKPFS
jgi:hypothetical protein